MPEAKRIAILAETGFDEVELGELTRAMHDIGYRVYLVGLCPGEEYAGRGGEFTVRVDIKAERVAVDDFDAIIVPGLNAASKIHLSRTALELVRAADSRGGIIAAIGRGPGVLMSAGIARGRRLTSAPELSETLRQTGAEWIEAPVVRDRNLITARKLVDLPRFCKAIIEAVGIDF